MNVESLHEFRVGQGFSLKPDVPQLYCNDGYQYGIEIQDILDEFTRFEGIVCSGKMKMNGSFCIRQIMTLQVKNGVCEHIHFSARQLDGYNIGAVPVWITVENFRKWFKI